MDNTKLMPYGTSEFSLGKPPCCGVGYSISEDKVKEALLDTVYKNHHSIDDLAELRKELALEGTGFNEQEISDTLLSFNGLEPWRIGETFAECWLETNRQCIFPWKTQHDIRSLKASLPGTDIVGISNHGGNHIFAFGEVKTSSDKNNPPSVMYGEKGLTYQLKSLIKSKVQRRQLIQNFGMRAKGQKWFQEYKDAFISHLQDKYRYWGMLIRDTDPNHKDIEYSINEFSGSLNQNILTEFIVLYSGLKISEWPNYCKAEGRV